MPEPAVCLWLAPEVAGAWAHGLPSVEAGSAAPLRPASGRGSLERATLGQGRVLVRTCRRGGLLRHLLPDCFLGARRAIAEALAAERLAALGLAPRVLGIEARGRVLVRLRVAVAEAEGAVDLRALARETPAMLASREVARAVGRTVRAMHDAGVAHADLNLSNLLWEAATGRALVIDLDGAVSSDAPVGAGRRMAEVLRLCRSMDKWRESAGASAAVRVAFLRAALPASLRLATLRRARRLQALRAIFGRRPR